MKKNLPISQKKKFKYSITFQSFDEESLEAGDSFDSGYEIIDATDFIGDILYKAYFTYGIYMPVAFGTWESTNPLENTDYWEKGIKKYFAIHISNEDETQISKEESDFITFLLSDGHYELNKFREYAVGGVVIGSIALGIGALITYFYFKGKKGGKSKKELVGKTSKSVTYKINGKDRKFPIKDAWKKEHTLENKSEDYEVPQAERFEMGGDASEHYHEIEYGEGGIARAKDVIINKIGFNEYVADYLVGTSEKFAIWLADTILKDGIKETNSSKKDVLKVFNERSKSVNNNFITSVYSSNIREILDWLQHPVTPKQNLKELSFDQALKKAREWHNELQVLGGDIDFTEPETNTILKKYPVNSDGIEYYWVFIPSNYCDLESSRMGHCGRTGYGNKLISLRSVKAYGKGHTISDSHVTIAYGSDGTFYQVKGKKNNKPSEKYFPYIFDLIKSIISENDIEYSKPSMTFDKNNTLKPSKSLLEFNGFGSEYGEEEDYGFEDMKKEEIREIFDLRPTLFESAEDNYMLLDAGIITLDEFKKIVEREPDTFSSFGNQMKLYERGIITEQPSTSFELKYDCDDVYRLLDIDRDFSDDVVAEILCGDIGELYDGWSYYYENPSDLVSNLNKENEQKVIDEIVRITKLDESVVKKNGIEYYLNGDDENFIPNDDFDNIIRSLASAQNQADNNDYYKYLYNAIESALNELGEVHSLNDEGVKMTIDLSNSMSLDEIAYEMDDYSFSDVEDLFSEKIGEYIDKPSLRIDDRYSPYGSRKDFNEYISDIDLEQGYKKGGVLRTKNISTNKKIKNMKSIENKFDDGGRLTHFNRHISMDSETRNELVEMTSYPFLLEYEVEENGQIKYDRIKSELKREGVSTEMIKNYLSGLFDGYNYSNTDAFKKEMAKLKLVDKEFYDKVMMLYEKISKYPKINVEYADGGDVYVAPHKKAHFTWIMNNYGFVIPNREDVNYTMSDFAKDIKKTYSLDNPRNKEAYDYVNKFGDIRLFNSADMDKFERKMSEIEVEFAGGGRVTTNDGIIEAFLTSNRELKVGNLSTHYNQYDNQMLLRNYYTLIATRIANDVSITNIKYSKTTTTITNKIRNMALQKRMNISYVDKFAEGGETQKVNLGNGEMDLDEAIKIYEEKIKAQGRVVNARDEDVLEQLKRMKNKFAEGGEAGGVEQNFEVGDIVELSESGWDNESYHDFFKGVDNIKLVITDVYTNESEHQGFDTGVGMALYSTKTLENDEEVPFDLYDYELEYSGLDLDGAKIIVKEIDADGNFSVEYDEENDEWYWEENYSNGYNNYRGGFSSELQAYNNLIDYLQENNYAKGGMTEHGLMEGDTIIGENGYQEDEVYILDKSKNAHIVNLDKGERFADGGETREFNYLYLKEVPNGLKLELTDEGINGYKEEEINDMDDLFEDIQANSEMAYIDNAGYMGFGLTEAPIITDGYYYDDMGEFTDEGFEDSKVYVWNDYMIKDLFATLMEQGSVVLTEVKSYAEGGEAGYELENNIISGKNFKNKYATDFNGQVAKVIYTQNLDLGSNLGKGSYWNVTQDSLDIYSGKRDEELDSKYGQYFKNTIYKEIDDNLKIFVKDEISDELWDNEKLYNKIKNISDGIYDPSYDDYGLLLFENQYAEGGRVKNIWVYSKPMDKKIRFSAENMSNDSWIDTKSVVNMSKKEIEVFKKQYNKYGKVYIYDEKGKYAGGGSTDDDRPQYNKAKSWKDIENHPLVDDTSIEENDPSEGKDYWVYLKNGYCWESPNSEQHIIHEWGVKDTIREFNNSIYRCNCSQCVNEGKYKDGGDTNSPQKSFLSEKQLKKYNHEKVGHIDFYSKKVSGSRYSGITKEVYFKDGFRPSFAVVFEQEPKEVYEKLKKWVKAQKKNFNDIIAVKYSDGGKAYAEGGETYVMTNDTYVNIFLSRGFTEKRSAYGLRFFEHKPTGIFITYDQTGMQTPVIISKNKSGEESIYEGNTIREVKQALDNAGVPIIKEGIDPTFAEGGSVGAVSKTKIQITDGEEGRKIATRTLIKENKNGERITYELLVGVFKDNKKGYFEIYATDSDDDEYFYAEGGLWIEGGRVVDYDGVYELSEKLKPLMSALNLNSVDVFAEGGKVDILGLYKKDVFSEKDFELIDEAIENGDIDTFDIKQDFLGYLYDRIDEEYKDNKFETEQIWEYTDEYYENGLPHKENYKKLISYLNNEDEEGFAEGGEVEDWMEQALASLIEETGFDELEITMVSDNGNEFIASDDNVEYRVFKTEDDAEEKAIEGVREDMEESPENFNFEFLMNNVYANDFITEELKKMNYSYVEDIASESDKKYANRLIAEMVENGLLDEDDAKSGNAEELADDLKSVYVDLLTGEQLEGGSIDFDYFINNYGEEETLKMFIENNVIDIDEASRDAVNKDGIAHFISSYDDITLYLLNNNVAYRNN